MIKMCLKNMGGSSLLFISLVLVLQLSFIIKHKTTFDVDIRCPNYKFFLYLNTKKDCSMVVALKCKNTCLNIEIDVIVFTTVHQKTVKYNNTIFVFKFFLMFYLSFLHEYLTIRKLCFSDKVYNI